jgi:hypothetical protein
MERVPSSTNMKSLSNMFWFFVLLTVLVPAAKFALIAVLLLFK